NNIRTYAIMSANLSFVQNTRFYSNFSINLSFNTSGTLNIYV
ncbi:hypothetical protein EVA_09140, partial [gut metagenome]